MTSSMLRRQLKNLVQNYSEAEVKVREATSNDPWGPSSSQMADISDLTYNVVACNEIMTMLWKRLKDDKNWRHIHKSLTLLEYLLKTGDDRVLLKMKDNIYIVKALTEYRFVEKDGKDQGANVREKAKVVLVLMEDDDKLKAERDFAVKTREKTSKSSAASSTDTVKDPTYKPCYVPGATGLPSLDNIPSVADLTASFAARKEERLRQETEKKEAERRAKMSEEELKWEDAGKGNNIKEAVWGQDEAEEEDGKQDAWGAPKQPKEATDPWGTPAGPDTADTPASSDPWGAPSKSDEDPFVAPKNGEDPFAAPKDEPDPFSASKDDPFSAPKDKEDPFASPKDKPDPFSSSNNDTFNAPQDDPFNAPQDDPFSAPKDDPFNAPKDDPFSASKDDPFSAPKDDPFNAPKDDPFNAPKDDPFSTSKDDPFNAPKDDPFNAPKDDPFNTTKDDPFNTPKDDPFSTQKDDPFTAPASTPPKEDPFAAPSSSKDDPFSATTTPPKEGPSSAPTKPAQDDPFAAPTTPPKEDPFTVLSSPTKDDASDPFNAPPVSSPQSSADAWGASASSPPASGSDPWGAPSAPNETKGGDPWGDGTKASSPIDTSDGFGDASKPDNDPWGAPATAPANTDDAWGSPAPPSDSSPSSDPFGDGASKKGDPWGAPSNGTGRRTAQEKETYRKTASFLGSAGASLVDLDDLFSSNPKPKQRPLGNTLAAQTQAIDAFKARDMPSGPVVRSGAVAGLSPPEPPCCRPFGSTLGTFFNAPPYTFGAVSLSSETPLFQLPSHTVVAPPPGSNMLHAGQVAPVCSGTGMVPSIMKPLCGGLEMGQSGSVPGNPLIDPLLVGPGMVQSSFSGGNRQAGPSHLGGSTSQDGGGILFQPLLSSGSELGKTLNKNNPFLF
uniref:epsin-2-like isoform X1 n=1 Tax=Scatophagus argus TaxID=75038 RepID=UPI001ED811E8|nr:epsin-2-like isoform X1 [Scatophagus argus]XP_046273458.1 epsin-2-like isoform X1 [Scatophagus argus]